jgi:hypothetical protein
MHGTYPKIQTLWKRSKETFKVLPGDFREPHYEAMGCWRVTEKLDGTNIRIGLAIHTDETKDRAPTYRHAFYGLEKNQWIAPQLFVEGKAQARVDIRGKTDKATLAPKKAQKELFDHILDRCTVSKLVEVFQQEMEDGSIEIPNFTLYGEGIGPKIQKGGGRYCKTQEFVLFDVKVGNWWLKWADVLDVARQLNFRTVPDAVIWYIHDDGFHPPGSPDDLTWWIEDLARNSSGLISPSIEEVEGIVARSNPMMFSRAGHHVRWKLKRKDF